jgi:hypothetical protein
MIEGIRAMGSLGAATQDSWKGAFVERMRRRKMRDVEMK